jgi:hypothetical protein
LGCVEEKPEWYRQQGMAFSRTDLASHSLGQSEEHCENYSRNIQRESDSWQRTAVPILSQGAVGRDWLHERVCVPGGCYQHETAGDWRAAVEAFNLELDESLPAKSEGTFARDLAVSSSHR